MVVMDELLPLMWTARGGEGRTGIGAATVDAIAMWDGSMVASSSPMLAWSASCIFVELSVRVMQPAETWNTVYQLI